MPVISITVDLMLRLKMLIINESKDTQHTYCSNCTLYIVKFSLDLILCFWPIFVDFQNEVLVYLLITQLIKDVK